MPNAYDPLDFTPPDPNVLSAVLAAQRAYHRPVFFGLEHLRRDRPTLFVGNHTIFGVMDAPLLVERIYRETGKLPRSLADHAHYRVPVWRDMLHRFGAVDGTRDNCRKLMQAKESVLVFPGGGREVAKRKGEAYELVWKQRVGFVRMALEHGYTITPFASVGAEECYSIHFDANDLRALPVWQWLSQGPMSELARGGDMVMPIATGVWGTPLPRRERFYFAFGEPIELEHDGGEPNEELLFALRRRVRERVEKLIEQCRAARAAQATSREGKRRVLRTALDLLGVRTMPAMSDDARAVGARSER